MGPSSGPVVAKEMSAALKRIRELDMGNEVLRAAAAYSSQETIRPKDLPGRGKTDRSGGGNLDDRGSGAEVFSPSFLRMAAMPVPNGQRQEEGLLEEIRRIHAADPKFGYRFIADELQGQGVRICE